MASIGIPSDDFPAAPAGLLPTVDLGLMQDYFDLAVRRRADLLASGKREAAAQTRLVAASNATKPEIDLNLSPGYSGLAEGPGGVFLQSPFHSIRGPDAVAGISYRFAPANNLAVGQMIAAKATAKQTELRSADLERNIMAGVASALQAVRNAARQVGEAHASVTAFQAALDGEREKFRLGMGSVIDVLTMEDRLTTALRNEVSANLAYALALAQLRAATGTIVSPSQVVQTVEPNLFYSPPSLAAGANP
jgi:outer membrane protein TolC